MCGLAVWAVYNMDRCRDLVVWIVCVLWSSFGVIDIDINIHIDFGVFFFGSGMGAVMLFSGVEGEVER